MLGISDLNEIVDVSRRMCQKRIKIIGELNPENHMPMPGWGDRRTRARRQELFPLPHTPERLTMWRDHLLTVQRYAPEPIDWVERDLVWLEERRRYMTSRAAGRAAAARRATRRATRKKTDIYARIAEEALYRTAKVDHALFLRRGGLSTYKIARRLRMSQAWVYNHVREHGIKGGEGTIGAPGFAHMSEAYPPIYCTAYPLNGCAHPQFCKDRCAGEPRGLDNADALDHYARTRNTGGDQ